MALIALSVPTIKVNNDVINIVPNSFKYVSGHGEVTVRAASTGGANAVSVHTQDAETMVSKVMFSLPNTVTNIERVSEWQSHIAGNTVEAIQKAINGKNFAIPFKGMSITNDPDIVAAADGIIDIEMAGDKLE